MPFTFVCDNCGKSFKRRNQSQKDICSHRFCSHTCYTNYTHNGRDVPCPTCSKLVYRPKSNIRKFCSRACYDASRGITTNKICVGCGKTFAVKLSIADRYNFCSFACKTKYRKGEWRKCITCGKRFWHKANDIKRGLDRKHCSEECRRPPIYIDCATCGKTFRRCPSQTNKRFCCFACYRKSNSETSIEKSVREALDSIGISYKQEGKIGRYSIDFLIQKLKIALEADGTYWHRDPARDRRKDAYLTKHGWFVCRITEKEINDTKNLSLFIANRLKDITSC